MCAPVLVTLVLGFALCFRDSGLVYDLWIYFDFVDLALLIRLTLCLVDLPWIWGFVLVLWTCPDTVDLPCLKLIAGVLFVSEGNFLGIVIQSWNLQ